MEVTTIKTIKFVYEFEVIRNTVEIVEEWKEYVKEQKKGSISISAELAKRRIRQDKWCGGSAQARSKKKKAQPGRGWMEGWELD